MSSAGTDNLPADFKEEFRRRRYTGGLLIAFVGFLRELGGFERDYEAFDDSLKDFRLSDVSARGGTANTLTVQVEGPQGETSLMSIRPMYNRAEEFFRIEHSRFDYPNCAPHATGQWHDYVPRLEALARLTPEESDTLEAAVKEHVLAELESHEIDPSELPPLERPFTGPLAEFDLSMRGKEPPGAAFQGAVYAYIRADVPPLHLLTLILPEPARVASVSGGSGTSMAGMENVWSSQSKSSTSIWTSGNSGRLSLFSVGSVGGTHSRSSPRLRSARRGVNGSLSLGAAALTFPPSLLELVDLWDPWKQPVGLSAFVSYVHHVEQKMTLMNRLADFLDSQQ